MKKTLLLLAMFSAAVGSAQAADMPVKAPVYVAPFTWTGVYLGINAGYGNSKSDGNEFCTTPTGVVGGTGCWNGSPAAVSSSGGFVGGQLGALVRGEEAQRGGVLGDARAPQRRRRAERQAAVRVTRCTWRTGTACSPAASARTTGQRHSGAPWSRYPAE